MSEAANVAGDAPNLLDDPVTGEKVSKSELKRRQKQRQKDAEKAEKAAKEPAPAKSAGGDAAAEEALTPNQYYEMRSRAIQKLRESRQPDPYPHKFHVSVSLTDFIKRYQDRVAPGESLGEEVVSVAGRLHNMRSSGQKLRFYDLHAEGVKIQILSLIHI